MAGPDGPARDASPAWIGAVEHGLKALELGAALILLALMVMTCIDVAGRELLGAPLNGATELTELFLGALVFLALPVASWRDEHIVVDLLDNLVPAGLARLRQFAVHLIGAVALAAVAVRAWHFADRSVEFGDVTEFLALPVAPIVYLISLLSGLTAVLLLLNGVRSAIGHAPRPPSVVG